MHEYMFVCKNILPNAAQKAVLFGRAENSLGKFQWHTENRVYRSVHFRSYQGIKRS